MEGEAGVTRAIILATALLTVASAGCSEGKRPFLMVQMCMPGEAADFDRLRSLFQTFADENELTFSDGSADQSAISKRLAKRMDPDVDVSELGTQLQLSIGGSDEFSASAGNLSDERGPAGLSGSSNQVAIGFNAQNESATTQELTADLLARLRVHWTVVTVPQDRGAFPLENCPPESS